MDIQSQERMGPFRGFLLWDVARDRQGRVVLYWAAATLFLGSFVYHYLEGWSWLDSLYFSVITLATVGYGDLAPTTPLARLFTVFYVMNGIGIFLALLDQIREVRQRRWRERHNAPPSPGP